MLCRTTAVFSWQVCKWEPQQTAPGSGSESCQKQDGRRGDGAHSEAQEPISTTGMASQSSHSPKSWIQYSIESLSSVILPSHPPTPRHLAMATRRILTWIQGYRLCSMFYSESSGDFMRYLAEMLGQELVWSPFRQWGRGERG